jgi:hypothetical protein
MEVNMDVELDIDRQIKDRVRNHASELWSVVRGLSKPDSSGESLNSERQIRTIETMLLACSHEIANLRMILRAGIEVGELREELTVAKKIIVTLKRDLKKLQSEKELQS